MNFITKRIRQILFMTKLQKRIMATVLTVCMVAGFLQMPGMTHSAKADNSALTSTVTKITLNGSELTNSTVVKNGDVLKIEFDWAIANTDKSTREFAVDLTALSNSNISISASDANSLMDNSGNVVGYYQVTADGKLKIVIENDEFLDKDGRKGGVVIEGKVNVTDTSKKDGDPVTIGLGTKTYTPAYNTGIATSAVYAEKATAGPVYTDGSGNFRQDFTLNINAYDGDVTGITIADTYGDALGEPANIKIVSSSVDDIEENLTFSTIAELNTYLSGKTLPQNKSFKISYTQPVDHTKTGAKNKAAVTYTNNKGAEVTKEAEATATLTDPTIDKAGAITGDGRSVQWTITIHLNDYALLGDLEDVVQSLIDTPGVGMADVTATDILANMTGSDGVYTYTYTAPISDQYLNSASTLDIKNSVTMTMKDGTEYSATGTVTRIPDNWLTKTVAGYDEGTKTLTWDVNIGPLPSGVTDIAVSDACGEPWASNGGNHSLQWGMSVDGVEVIDSSGAKTAAFDTYLSSYNQYWVGDPLVLNNTYVSSKYGDTIKVTFTTKITDDSLVGKVYNNRAEISYMDPSLGETKTKTADGQFKKTDNLVTKDGAPVSGKNSVRYRVKMYLAGYELETGKNIVVTEQFPTGLVYNSGAADLQASVQDPWGNSKLSCPVTYDDVAKTFTVQVTDEMKNMISEDNPYLVVAYNLDVEDVAAFTMGGTQSFTNNATAKYDGVSLGSGSATVSLTPQKIVTKNGNYSASTAPYAEYEVIINEEGLDLLPDPGTLSATDTLGSALSYEISTIKVEKYEGSTWTTLTKGTEYKCSYDQYSNSLTFTELPDSVQLRITYKARVNIAYGEELTAENSTNAFSLNGTGSSAVEASKGFSVVAVKPDGWATSEEGEIKLYKFWTDEGQMVALPASEFKVVKMKYNEETNSMEEDPGQEGDVDWNNGDATLESGITVGADGYVTIKGLSYARIYALIETAAPAGFAVNTEPYYFVLAGSEATLPPESSGIKVSTFSTGSNLLYENKKSDVGTLEVTKSLSGVDASDVASVLSKLSFEVKKDGVTISGGSFLGTGMTLTDGVYKKTFTNLATGDYTVTEKMTDVDGYIYQSSTYKVTVGESAGAESSYTVGNAVASEVADGTTTVAFTNTYAKTANLSVKKTVSGDADWDDIKDSIVFYVYDKTDMTTPIATINGSDLAADGSGYSKLIEGLDPSKTYVVKESGAALSGYTKTTTYQIGSGAEASSADDTVTTSDITLVAGETETVSFENAYVVHTGTLKLTKGVDFDTLGITWDDVKSSLNFEVKSVATGEVVCQVSGDAFSYNSAEGIYEYTVPGTLPIGSYVVTETVTDITGMIVTTSYTVTTGGGASGANGRVADVEIAYNEESVVAYENLYKTKYATLVLKKTVSGDRAWDDIKDQISFTVTGPDALHSWVIAGSDPGFVAAGDGTYTYKIENIDLGGEYTVTETFSSEDTENYTRTTTVKVDNDTPQTADTTTIDFEIPQGATVQFDNDYERNVGNLVLKKTLAGVAEGDLNLAESRITFVVTPSPVDDSPSKAYKLSDFTKNLDGSYTLALSGVPTGTYHVRETVYQIEDHDVVSVEYTLTTALGASSAVAGGQANGADATVASGKSTTVAVEDEYKKHVGNLEFTKKVTGDRTWDQVKDKMSFRVTNEETGYDETFTYEDFTDEDSDGVYLCKITDVPLGTYVVTETLQDIAGYTTTTTYQIGAGSAQIGKEGSLTLLANGSTAHMAFVNDYDALTGSIMLKKSVIGDAEWFQVRDSLSFVLMQGSTTIKTINASQFTGPDSDGNYHYVISGVADGTYTIKEIVSGENTVAYTRTTTVTVDDGSAVSGLQGNVTFDSSKGATATIVNNYSRNRGRLVLKKTIAGVDAGDIAAAEAAVQFTVTPSPTDAAAKKVYTLSDFTKQADGTYMLEIFNVPTGTYHVKETAYTIGGYDVGSVDYTLTSAAGANSSVANGQANGTDASVVTGKVTTVAVKDAYTKTPTDGTLVITKTVSGDITPEEAKDYDITFKVKNNSTGVVSTYELTEFDYNPTTKKYSLSLPLVAGGYEVEETSYGIDGYAATVTYSVDGAAPTEDAKTSVTVPLEDTVVVDFENNYRQLLGKLKIVKGCVDADFEAVKDKISFMITGPNGYSKEVKGDQLVLDPMYSGAADAYYSYTVEDLPIGIYTITETIGNVVGYTCQTTVSVGEVTGNANAIGDKALSLEVKDGVTSLATYQNYYETVQTGKIRITKTLKGDVTEEEAEGALQFKVTNTDTGEVTTYTLADFTKQPDGTYVLELDANVGGYEVEETIYDIDGYITDSVKYSVNGGAAVDDSLAAITVEDGVTTTVAFEDAYTKDEGKLVITKTLKGDVTKEEAEGALQFKVTNNDTGESTIYTLKDFTYDSATGIYTLELDVPSGSYTVEETIYDIDGYITASVKRKIGTGEYTQGTKADVTVEVGESINVDFEDTYEINEGKLVLTKSVKGDLAWDDIKDTLSFVVKNEETGESKTYKASSFKDEDGDGIYTVVIDGLALGKYTVTEKLDDVKGYLLETMYVVDGGSRNYGSKAKVTLGKDGAKVDFVNTYTSTKGKLVITKTLKGNIDRKDAEAVIEFKVTNTKTKKSKTYTLSDFTYDKETEKYVLELSLEPGTYKVTETVYDVEGYKLKSVTYQVGDGEREEGNAAKAKVKTGKTIKVAFIDKYYKTKTSDNSTSETPPTSTTTSTTGRDTPKTGDESPLMLWLMMLLLGACGIAGSAYGLRKNRK